MCGACRVYGERRGVHRFMVGQPEERDHLGDPGLDGNIILRWIFSRWKVGCVE
jgi:hypothetical protein